MMRDIIVIVLIILIILLMVHIELFNEEKDCVNCGNNDLNQCLKCDTCGICELKNKTICVNGDKDGPMFIDDCITYKYKDNDVITNSLRPILSLYSRKNGKKSNLSNNQLIFLIIGSIVGGILFIVAIVILAISIHRSRTRNKNN